MRIFECFTLQDQKTEMRKLKLFVKNYFILLLLSLCYLNSHGLSRVVVKANILRGEPFITAKVSGKEIETKVSEIFTRKGFDVVTNLDSTEDILFVDFFVYQFPAQYPAVTITIRTQKGVHYIDQEYDKVFVDREVTSLNMATRLSEKVPTELNKEVTYRISMGDLITANKYSSSALYSGNSKYYSTINWKANTPVPFMMPNDLRLYLLYASNFTGLKKILSKAPILLKLRINSSARFELVNVNSNSNLDEDQKIRILEFINSFPLWVTNSEVEDIEIVYGLK
jgi:hypothetical protein